jgi:hypothetical protein
VPKVTAEPGVWLRHQDGEAEHSASIVKTYQWTPVRHPRPPDGTASYRVSCMKCKKMVLWTVTNAADTRWARNKWRLAVLASVGVLAVSILGMTLNEPLEALGAFGMLASVLAIPICLLFLHVQDGVDIPEERKRFASPHSIRRPPKYMRPQRRNAAAGKAEPVG